MIYLGVVALALAGCGRQTWQAVGYPDRSQPEAGRISLGTYDTEAEARAAGIGYTKGDAKHDYIIGVLKADGQLSDTHR